MDIFDSHQHCGDVIPGWGDTFGKPAASDPVAADLAGRLPMLDAHGIGQALLMPSMSYERADAVAALRALNDRVAAFRAARPDRFPIAFGTVDLWLGDAALAETKRALQQLRLDGLAWHHRLQGAYIDDPRMHAILRELAAARKPALIHCYSESTFEAPWRLENLAEAHRDVQFIAADIFSSYDQTVWVSRLGRKHPNLWFDTAAMTGNASTLAQVISAIGDERILLGTNCYGPLMSDWQPTALDLLRASNSIPGESKQKILGGNARRLFGLGSGASR
jgi:predicted TIM-barrel fold metal-dependent hydrolase